jgi:hypothetical protein
LFVGSKEVLSEKDCELAKKIDLHSGLILSPILVFIFLIVGMWIY